MPEIPLIKPDLPPYDELAPMFREIIESGQITNFGKYVQKFEDAAAAYLGTQVATVSSCTAGLLMTLQALGVEPGSKVILPSFTFMATAQAVVYAGGTPIFAEIEDDLTLSPSDLAQLLEAHQDVDVVIGVHAYGLPAHVDEIQQVIDDVNQRQDRRVKLMYDAAHGFGASLDGRKVGGFGDAEVFSLSVTKLLVSVEGGMVSSRNKALIDRIKLARNYGIESSYNATLPGLNGKMSELHAAVGAKNLERIDDLLQMRAERARYYIEQLQERTRCETMSWPEGVTQTFKDFTVFLPEELVAKRDAITQYLAEHDVASRLYFYPPVHQQGYFERFADRPLPKTEALSRRVITLPFYSTMTKEEMDYVVATLADAERLVA
ncbi:MAG TPA: DegT/DnrJ/EryC1/StrS family aminotransferase [Thermomicrobiaceae bacterium]|nr:DegT/DnrJ/EryC1/StrS family aminotransferase [Thermomicrobiaceae bacterium]